MHADTRSRVARRLAAALFAAAATALLLLGVDGFLGAMHRLTDLYLTARPAQPEAAAPAAPAEPGVVSAFIVPAGESPAK